MKEYMQIHMSYSMLHTFIKFLKENGLLQYEESKLLQSEDLQYDTGLMIQNYSYLATKFGLDMGYEYSIYIAGPHSEDMADEYYELFENPKSLGSDGSTTLPDSFDRDGFLRLARGRTMDWLDIATTLLDMQYLFTEDAPLIEHVECRKHNYSMDLISTVLQDLRKHNMVNFEKEKLHA